MDNCVPEEPRSSITLKSILKFLTLDFLQLHDCYSPTKVMLSGQKTTGEDFMNLSCPISLIMKLFLPCKLYLEGNLFDIKKLPNLKYYPITITKAPAIYHI